MTKLDGKTAVVTGGGSGLGEASSELLAEEGAQLVVTDLNEAAAEHTADIIRQKGGSAIALVHDVTQQSQWRQVVDAAIEEFGSLDVLVNNAGVSGAMGLPMEEVEFEAWREVMSINLDAVARKL